MTFCDTTLQQLPSREWDIAFGVLIAIISFFAFIENGFILLLFLKYPTLRTTPNRILASVVTADWLIGLTSGPLYSSQLLSDTLNNYCIVHKLRRGFSVVIMGASLLSIGMLTIDRYRNLTTLQKGYTLGNRWLYTGLLVCWILPIVGAFVGTISNRVHSAIVSLVGIGMLVVVLICYVLVIIALKRHRQNSLNKKNAVYMKNERKAAKTVIIILTCFLLMLLPLYTEKGLVSFKILAKDTPIASVAHMSAILLYIGNAVVNPLIYAGRLPAIRKCAASFLRLETRCKRNCSGVNNKGFSNPVVAVRVSSTSTF